MSKEQTLVEAVATVMDKIWSVAARNVEMQTIEYNLDRLRSGITTKDFDSLHPERVIPDESSVFKEYQKLVQDYLIKPLQPLPLKPEQRLLYYDDQKEDIQEKRARLSGDIIVPICGEKHYRNDLSDKPKKRDWF